MSLKKSVDGWGEETSSGIGHLFFGYLNFLTTPTPVLREIDKTDEKVSIVDAGTIAN